MPRMTWTEIERRRMALPRPLSRAELARRAGLSESTIAKGLRDDRVLQKGARDQVLLVLEAARIEAEELP